MTISIPLQRLRVWWETRVRSGHEVMHQPFFAGLRSGKLYAVNRGKNWPIGESERIIGRLVEVKPLGSTVTTSGVIWREYHVVGINGRIRKIANTRSKSTTLGYTLP